MGRLGQYKLAPPWPLSSHCNDLPHKHTPEHRIQVVSKHLLNCAPIGGGGDDLKSPDSNSRSLYFTHTAFSLACLETGFLCVILAILELVL